MPGDHVEEQRGVGDGGGERADLIQRARERDEAVARHESVGGLHADDPAERGGLADRPAGIGAETERCVLGGNRGRGTAARAAGNP